MSSEFVTKRKGKFAYFGKLLFNSMNGFLGKGLFVVMRKEIEIVTVEVFSICSHGDETVIKFKYLDNGKSGKVTFNVSFKPEQINILMPSKFVLENF